MSGRENDQPHGLSELLGHCHLMWKRLCSRACLPHGISLKQRYVLELLAEGPLSPGDIADALFCDKPTASVIIANLAKQGWVSKEADENDKRRAMIHLGKKGREKLDDLRKTRASEQNSSPFACLDPQEKEILRALLKKVHAHLESMDGQP